jgi:hypothetical protein
VRTAWIGRTAWSGLACIALTLAGCGGPSATHTEVTEPWTSGDEAALGISEPEPAPSPAGRTEGGGEPTSR